MKTIKLILLIISLYFCYDSYGDIIPNNSHYVDKCVKISNISDYDNLTLLGYVMFFGQYENTYIISETECLSEGHKFNTLRIFAINADYIDGKDINNIDWPNDSHALETNIKLEPYAGYYHDSIPIDRIEEYYKILGFSHTSVILFKWKEVIGFNNGLSDSVNIYSYTGDTSIYSQKTPTGIINVSKLPINISLYPNPTGKNVKINISNSFIGTVNIQMFSSDEKMLFSSNINKRAEQITINLPTYDYPSGVYLIRFQLGDAIETKRLIVKQN